MVSQQRVRLFLFRFGLAQFFVAPLLPNNSPLPRSTPPFPIAEVAAWMGHHQFIGQKRQIHQWQNEINPAVSKYSHNVYDTLAFKFLNENLGEVRACRLSPPPLLRRRMPISLIGDTHFQKPIKPAQGRTWAPLLTNPPTPIHVKPPPELLESAAAAVQTNQVLLLRFFFDSFASRASERR